MAPHPPVDKDSPFFGDIYSFGGIYWLNQIYKRLKDKEGKQEERKEQRYEELITELKGIREDLNKR